MIDDVFFPTPDRLDLFVCPTWSCNLRCPFCYVLGSLKGSSVGVKDPSIAFDALKDFIERHGAAYQHRTLSFGVLGGESLLNPKACLEAIMVAEDFKRAGWNVRTFVTTNLTPQLTNESIEFLKLIDNITVSIDGINHDHSRPLAPGVEYFSPLKQAITNLIELKKHGCLKKVQVQAALNEDANEELFFRMLRIIGIGSNQILLGRKNNTTHFRRGRTGGVRSGRTSPCCVWRYMQFFMVDAAGLHGNYYDKDGSFFGTCSVEIADLQRQYREYISEKMPAFRDPVCRACPVLTKCWGGCNGIFEDKNQPSATCDQPEMIRILGGDLQA